jgi:hypothetical protein
MSWVSFDTTPALFRHMFDCGRRWVEGESKRDRSGVEAALKDYRSGIEELLKPH